MSMWLERDMSYWKGITILQTFENVTSKQTQWLFAVCNVTVSLSSNSLLFRGDKDGPLEGNGEESGLFQRIFTQMLFLFKPKWKEIYNIYKKCSIHLLPIQNEIISALVSLVKKNIESNVHSAKIFNVMEYGTIDKNRVEVQGLICRYLLDGEIRESCLDMSGVNDQSADSLEDFIKNLWKMLTFLSMEFYTNHTTVQASWLGNKLVCRQN